MQLLWQEAEAMHLSIVFAKEPAFVAKELATDISMQFETELFHSTSDHLKRSRHLRWNCLLTSLSMAFEKKLLVALSGSKTTTDNSISPLKTSCKKDWKCFPSTSFSTNDNFVFSTVLHAWIPLDSLFEHSHPKQQDCREWKGCWKEGEHQVDTLEKSGLSSEKSRGKLEEWIPCHEGKRLWL